jgi:hypothetical protein
MLDLNRLQVAASKSTNKEAWDQIFGEPYTYVISTVSTYVRWMNLIVGQNNENRDRLNDYLTDHPDHTVKEGKKHFKKEWKEANPPKKEKDGTWPTKRAKFNK